MNVIASLQPVYSLAGFMVGILIGSTGVGGGSLMTPLLILLFGLHPAVAVGTDLLFAPITKSAGALVHGINGTIEWSVVRRLAAGSVPMAVLTMFALGYIDINSPAANDLMTVVLILALMITAVVLLLRKLIVSKFGHRLSKLSPRDVANLTIAVGAFLGFIVSISSVGAGAIGITALVLLYPQLPIVRIVGSDIAHAVPLTLAAGIVHLSLGTVDLPVLASLVLGSIPGILLSSYVAARIPDRALRVVLAVILFLVATKLSIGLHLSALTNFAFAGSGEH